MKLVDIFDKMLKHFPALFVAKELVPLRLENIFLDPDYVVFVLKHNQNTSTAFSGEAVALVPLNSSLL